jgi:carbamoyltransferase
MSLVLGISNTGHDASAAIFRDGKLIAAIAEERLSRVKGVGGYIPQQAIDEVLRLADATRQDVTHIAMMCGYFPEEYFERPNLKTELWRKFVRLRRRLRGKPTEIIATGHVLRETIGTHKTYLQCFRKSLFLKQEQFNLNAQVSIHAHHDVHAILAGFYAGHETSLVITADGYGDLDEVHSSNIFRSGKLEHLSITEGLGRSPGLFYQIITELLGFRPVRHEGKVLGLAAFGNPAALLDTFKHALRISPCGTKFDSDFEAYEDRKAFLSKSIRGHSREDVAAAAQQTLEDAYVSLVRNQIAQTGLRYVAMNGGVAANVKLNQRIAALPGVDSIFVYPGMSDTGNCVGCALLALEMESPGFIKANTHVLHDVYLGPSFSDQEIEAELQKQGLSYEKLNEDQLIDRAARAMHDGLVLGWFQGRMELGPRALGNRSMVGRPTDAGINKSLNDRLERTEFMPFAPSVLAECAADIFENLGPAEHAAEFMTVTFDVKPEWKARIPAVVHVDGTARPQIVRADRNRLYHKLISRYSQLSGIPLVLNTSFNVHEEPIVCSPAEGVRAVAEDRIDALAIGTFWVDNPKQSAYR